MSKYSCASILCLASILCGAAFYATAAFAQTASCTIPQQNLWYGESDGTTGDGVSALQNFLFHEGYVSSQSYVTGYFGPITLAAVKKFQAAHEVPAAGFVGTLTRVAINALPACTITAPGTVSITSISPSQGAVGSRATITGTGFTSSNTILMNGDVAASDISPMNGTLTFTIPGSMGPYCKPMEACPMYELLVSKGTYSVTVLNDSGTSNALSYTITSAPSPFSAQR